MAYSLLLSIRSVPNESTSRVETTGPEILSLNLSAISFLPCGLPDLNEVKAFLWPFLP
jgi:hypothetical protein